ncbi:oxidative damage protection protein [Buchnera aphidicola]|uniref:Probable Fe(2+)-trafficking protein, partial n=1 Tax=Buchnera aphidicola subsp. Tuberolachnus salignus TaxID=98804 RepID=A0A160SYK0_BUCTT|nr:oxidative damage protection protein [Buchnera aphidicola]CUR53344.1 Probable Fe(2+)-trafficking protein [Buchnera aphidicola (Tuberolachnus salignus)]
MNHVKKRIIFCTFLKKYSEGLNFQCYPGLLGQKIYNEISQIAWQQWLNKQTKIINEKKLNMCSLKDRKYLEKHMKNFFWKKT